MQGGATNEHVDMCIYEALHHVLPSIKLNKHNSTERALWARYTLLWPHLGIGQ